MATKSGFSLAIDGLDLSNTTFVILAIDSLKLIVGKLPYLLDIGEETALDRVVRQIEERGGKSTICTNRPQILESYKNAVLGKIRCDRECLKLLESRPLWGKNRTVLLYGNAVYSDETIDRIALIDTDMAMFGDYEEILAFSFSSSVYKRLDKALNKWEGYLYGDTNLLYRDWVGLDVLSNEYEPYGESMTVYRPLDDYSCRLKTTSGYMRLISRGSFHD
jgi:hypothetical protein